jgi:two-component system cell cycle sensor histidine kinase/response regulator CckA
MGIMRSEFALRVARRFPGARSTSRTTMSTPTIVVIDDDAILREALSDWLQAAGYGVCQAGDGSTGLAAVGSVEPGLVVTDMHMPGMNGWGVLTEMRRLHPAVPVIAISGHFGSAHGIDVTGALALGASRVLAKPFKRGELLQAVAELLDG